MKIEITTITQAARHRTVDTVKVKELADSISSIGLINPITVSPENRLIAGAHRLEAAKKLGWSDIECTVLDTTELTAELAEIDENLIRNELDMVTVGELAVRRDELFDALGLRAKSGDNQHSGGSEINSPPQTTESIAKAIGIGERTLQYNKQLANNLTPKAKAMVRSIDVSKQEAIKLSRKTPEVQDEIADKIERGIIKHVDDFSKPHVANNSGENEWYTPAEYAEAVRSVLGAVDLDPASSRAANEIIKANRFYTADEDGLTHDWAGRVFLNPPYASELIGKFIDKLAMSIESGGVTEAIVLVNNATETKWFARLGEVASVLCFPAGRLKFWHPEKSSATPLQGQVVAYCGSNTQAFVKQFKKFGLLSAIVKT